MVYFLKLWAFGGAYRAIIIELSMIQQAQSNHNGNQNYQRKIQGNLQLKKSHTHSTKHKNKWTLFFPHKNCLKTHGHDKKNSNGS